MKTKDYCFGEWVHIESDDDLEDANEYLRLWLKFFLRKIPHATLLDESIIEKGNPADVSLYLQRRTLAIKILVNSPLVEDDPEKEEIDENR